MRIFPGIRIPIPFLFDFFELRWRGEATAAAIVSLVRMGEWDVA